MKKAKRHISLILCVVMILAISVTAYAAVSSSYTARYVNGSAVLFHEGPSTTSNVLGQMEDGEQFNQIALRSGWSYGWPAPGTNVYEYYGGQMKGYIASYYLD